MGIGVIAAPVILKLAFGISLALARELTVRLG